MLHKPNRPVPDTPPASRRAPDPAVALLGGRFVNAPNATATWRIFIPTGGLERIPKSWRACIAPTPWPKGART